MIRTLPVLLLVACGPKIDPLHPLKAEVAAARRAGVEGAPPHARVAVANATLGRLVRRNIADPDHPIVVPVMLGTSAVIQPTLEAPRLSIGESLVCDCPRTELSMRGTLDIRLQGLLGRQTLAEGLGFEARAVGSARLGLDRAEGGDTVIQLMPVAQDPWNIQITLDEPQGMINDELVATQVSRPLVETLAKPLLLAKIPSDAPVKLAHLELEIADDLTAAVWLRGKPASPPPAVEVDEGWALGMKEDALTAAARAVFAEVKQHPRWKLEPLAVDVEDGTWSAQVRLHKVARRSKYRDYRIDGTFTLADDEVTIGATEVERTAKAGWGVSLVSLFVDGRVRKQASRTEITLPTFTDREVNGRIVRMKVTGIRSAGDDVFVSGSLALFEIVEEDADPEEEEEP